MCAQKRMHGTFAFAHMLEALDLLKKKHNSDPLFRDFNQTSGMDDRLKQNHEAKAAAAAASEQVLGGNC